MRIARIDNTNFQAGNVVLKNVNTEKLRCFDSVKKFAEDNNLDIIIRKCKDTKYLPLNDFYLIFVKSIKNMSGLACVLPRKGLSTEETSVKIFNGVITALEDMFSKINKVK